MPALAMMFFLLSQGSGVAQRDVSMLCGQPGCELLSDALLTPEILDVLRILEFLEFKPLT